MMSGFDASVIASQDPPTDGAMQVDNVTDIAVQKDAKDDSHTGPAAPNVPKATALQAPSPESGGSDSRLICYLIRNVWPPFEMRSTTLKNNLN
jgi:hypothetical protein